LDSAATAARRNVLRKILVAVVLLLGCAVLANAQSSDGTISLPEPGSLLLLGSGGLALVGLLRRKLKK